MYKKISEYGVIGNCRTAALVSVDGSIDWSCLPDFDSPAFFCSILDKNKGGYFKIAPIGVYKSYQNYVYHTNILETNFFDESGSVVLSDFMPLTGDQEEKNSIPEYGVKFVRKMKAIRGAHKIGLWLKITADFARKETKISYKDGFGLVAECGDRILVLWTDAKIKIKGTTSSAEIYLKEGEEATFALGFFEKGQELGTVEGKTIKNLYDQTYKFWRWWASLARYRGKFYEEVVRSALTLKLLTFNPTGAVVASPTTSLPEKIGGFLNWDYRYTWLRDASQTMYALLGLGYLKEATEFMNWVERVALREGEDIRIMYGIRGEVELKEEELPHLEGYMESAPVRIGNAAATQRQFDVFGEVLTTINIYTQSGGKLSPKMKEFVKRLVDYCCIHWKEEDAGIWEERDGYKHHTYSKLMCWVGIDRGIRIARKLKIRADFEFWKATQDEIKVGIIEKGYDRGVNSFVESYGSDIIDASNLNFPKMGFLFPNDKAVVSTLRQTLSKLTSDWFVFRTSNEKDELKKGEGAFFLATFWLIDNLSLQGRIKEAEAWLEKVVHFATPLGLYAEEFDPYLKNHLGNYPTAFTHLGLINSVLTLSHAKKFGRETRATTPSERIFKDLGVVVLKGSRRTRRTIREILRLLLPESVKELILRDAHRKTQNY